MRPVLGGFPRAQLGKLCLEFLVHRDVHIAVELNEQGKQHQRALNALDQRKLLVGPVHVGAEWKVAEANSIP